MFFSAEPWPVQFNDPGKRKIMIQSYAEVIAKMGYCSALIYIFLINLCLEKKLQMNCRNLPTGGAYKAKTAPCFVRSWR